MKIYVFNESKITVHNVQFLTKMVLFNMRAPLVLCYTLLLLKFILLE